jgi:hypothetical protein
MQIRKWLSWFCFVVAPLLGLFGILLGSSLEIGFWRSLPYISHIVGTVFLLVLGASLLVLYAVFVTMIVTWDIDRISYAVEEEAQRRFLKRISPEKPEAADPNGSQDEAGKGNSWGVPSAMSAAFESLIARRAEFLWQNLLQSGCIDFPRADVKLAIKAIREESPAGDTGILDALKTLIVSKLFAHSYIPRLRLKIMDKLVTKFTREISILFVSVWTVFLATVLLWAYLAPGIFSTRPDAPSIFVFVVDLTLRGAIFTVFDHLGISFTHLAPSAGAKLFIVHTLVFRLFMSLFVIATFIKVLKLLLRRHALAG